jgi:hypothetical protein
MRVAKFVDIYYVCEMPEKAYRQTNYLCTAESSVGI